MRRRLLAKRRGPVRRRVLGCGVVLGAVLLVGGGAASPALAAPAPTTGSSCSLPISLLCTIGRQTGISSIVSFASDPFGYIANEIKNALTTLFTYFGHLLDATSSVDLTNPGFLKTYAIMFAVAVIPTILMWLAGVVKRVIDGVGVATAVVEGVGLLVLAVATTAFAPAIVAVFAQLSDAMADAVFSPTAGNLAQLSEPVLAAWGVLAALGGGSLITSVLGIALLFAVVGVWVELVIRSALVYITLVFGPLTFAGLVHRSLWSHTRRWIGLMIAVLLSKLVILTIVELAIGLMANSTSNGVMNAFATMFSAIALMYLALVVPWAIARFVPYVGDDLMMSMLARQNAHAQLRSATPGAITGAQEIALNVNTRLGQIGGSLGAGVGTVLAGTGAAVGSTVPAGVQGARLVGRGSAAAAGATADAVRSGYQHVAGSVRRRGEDTQPDVSTPPPPRTPPSTPPQRDPRRPAGSDGEGR